MSAAVTFEGAYVAARPAFADVYSEHHQHLVRLAWAITGSAPVAEDVVADVFAKVWVRWERGQVDDAGPYLRRAVVNEVRSWGRRLQVARRQTEKLHGDTRGVRLLEDDVADHDEMRKSLATLPIRQRTAVVLRYYEDLSVAETAKAMGCSEGTVKSQVKRGLDKLRAELERTEVHDGH